MRTQFFTFNAGTSPSTLPSGDSVAIVTARVDKITAEQDMERGEYHFFIEGKPFCYRVDAATYLDFISIISNDQQAFLHHNICPE